jgi:nucleotide-binding universal stress UspA family protein
MPLLRSAETVTILSAGTDDPDQGADELKRFLEHRGVKSSVQSFKASRDVPDELMERSKAAGATIMIMGAYGDSHEKETLFGGNTQRIVDTANMPILMVH